MQKRSRDCKAFHKGFMDILRIFYLNLIITILAFITLMINSEHSIIFFYILTAMGILCLGYTSLLAKKNRDLIYQAEALLRNDYQIHYDKLTRFFHLMEANQFQYHFQPIIDAKTGEIFAYEALMRTDSDTIGLDATEILELAAHESCLYNLEKYTFDNVMRFMKEHTEIFYSKKLFINSISSHQLTDDDFNKLYQTYSSMFANVVIEITESTMLTEKGYHMINSRLKQTNCQIALDDYGTGYSNEFILLNSNPDYIKIDGSILRSIHLSSKKQHLVRNLINFAEQNHIKVIAEGIETYEELEYVIGLGVDYIQGIYTATPCAELLLQLPEQKLMQIQEINRKNYGNSSISKLYETRGEKLLSPVTLTHDMYTDIAVLEEELTLQGNQGMVANISILIPDNRCCTLILEQVNLRGHNKPTILLGNNCSVTIRLVGDNNLSYDGIRVPETSSLTITGSGSLIIQAECSSRIGIGGTASQAYGNITLATTGIIKIISSGNTSIGIGGGKNTNNSLIHLISGNIYIETSGFCTVGVGCIEGSALIRIEDCKLKLLSEGTKAVGIGSFRGNIDLISSGNLVVQCNGRNITAIGGMEESEGKLLLANGVINISLNGLCGSGIGAVGGRVNVEVLRGDISINGEGSDIVGIGDHTGYGEVYIKNGTIHIELYATNAMPIGNMKRYAVIDGGNIQCNIPDSIKLTNSFGAPLVPRSIMVTEEFRQIINTVSYSYEYLASYSDRYPDLKVYLPEGIL